jgi:hypothetical protein
LFSLYRFVLKELNAYSDRALQSFKQNGGVHSKRIPNESRAAVCTHLNLSLVVIFARNVSTDADKMASVYRMYCKKSPGSLTPLRTDNSNTHMNM